MSIAIFVTPELPQANRSGLELRTFSWLKKLSQTHQVYVVVISRDILKKPRLPEDYPAKKVFFILLPARTLLELIKYALDIPHILFFRFSLFNRRGDNAETSLIMKPTINALTACFPDQAPTKILVCRLHLNVFARTFFRRWPTAIREMDLDDHESASHFSLAYCVCRLPISITKKTLLFARFYILAIKARVEENVQLKIYQHIWVAAKCDIPNISKQIDQPVDHYPNFLAFRSPLVPAKDDLVLQLLFIGSLHHPPNEEAVYWLITELIPQLNCHPFINYRLNIIGSNASSALQAYTQNAHQVDFHPNAASVLPYYEKTHIVLTPLFAGGGTKYKTLEAFAHQRALIATPEAVRDINDEGKPSWLCATTAKGFTEAIINLWQNPQQRQKIAENGYQLFLKQYCADWSLTNNSQQN